METGGNPATYLTADSAGAALQHSTQIHVVSTSGFPPSGTMVVITSAGAQTVTYTGLTATTFTGCTGGTGTMELKGRVGRSDSQAGLNHTTATNVLTGLIDPHNHTLMIRGAHDVTIRDCVFQQELRGPHLDWLQLD